MEGFSLNLHLDTQVAIFLSAGQTQRFSSKAVSTIEEATFLYISPMVLLEIEYLFERGKIKENAEQIAADLERKIGLRVSDLSMRDIACSSLRLQWTRDPFDRLITATAIADHEAPLLTSDRNIQEHYSESIRSW